FNMTVLDAQGRAIGGVIGGRPTNWLQVMPGERLECNGCHNPNANPSFAHRPPRPFTSVNKRAPATGSPLPHTNAALFADMGETMAQVRNRIMCNGACAPSVDVAFEDYWPATASTAPKIDACYRAGASTVQNDPADPTSHTVCMNGLNTEVPLM